MPRKTGIKISTTPKTPYELGPKLIDDQGDSVTDPNLDAVRTSPVGAGAINMSTFEELQSDSLVELKRIRRANELILGQDVDVPTD